MLRVSLGDKVLKTALEFALFFMKMMALISKIIEYLIQLLERSQLKFWCYNLSIPFISYYDQNFMWWIFYIFLHIILTFIKSLKMPWSNLMLNYISYKWPKLHIVSFKSSSSWLIIFRLLCYYIVRVNIK